MKLARNASTPHKFSTAIFLIYIFRYLSATRLIH